MLGCSLFAMSVTLPSQPDNTVPVTRPGLINSLANLRFLDWLSLAILLGVVFGLLEGVEALLLSHLGVPQILWATPIVDCAIAAVILLGGMCLYRLLRRPIIL